MDLQFGHSTFSAESTSVIFNEIGKVLLQS